MEEGPLQSGKDASTKDTGNSISVCEISDRCCSSTPLPLLHLMQKKEIKNRPYENSHGIPNSASLHPLKLLPLPKYSDSIK